MNTLPPPPLHDFQEAITVKYIGAVGLVFLIYDHIISIGDEVELVWKAKWTFAKAIFLLVRYAVPCALIVYNYEVVDMKSLHKPNSFCRLWFNIMVCLAMTTIAIGNFLVLLRLWVIRSRNRIFICSTFVLFVLSHVASFTFVIVVLINISSSLIFDSELSMCVIKRRKILGILFIPAVIFDGLALGATIWNALGRPRSQGTGLMHCLRQDGFSFVLLLFLMRVINLFSTLLGPLHIIFPTAYIIWATTTVTLSWLVLDLRRNGRLAKNTQLDPD